MITMTTGKPRKGMTMILQSEWPDGRTLCLTVPDLFAAQAEIESLGDAIVSWLVLDDDEYGGHVIMASSNEAFAGR